MVAREQKQGLIHGLRYDKSNLSFPAHVPEALREFYADLAMHPGSDAAIPNSDAREILARLCIHRDMKAVWHWLQKQKKPAGLYDLAFSIAGECMLQMGLAVDVRAAVGSRMAVIAASQKARKECDSFVALLRASLPGLLGAVLQRDDSQRVLLAADRNLIPNHPTVREALDAISAALGVEAERSPTSLPRHAKGVKNTSDLGANIARLLKAYLGKPHYAKAATIVSVVTGRDVDAGTVQRAFARLQKAGAFEIPVGSDWSAMNAGESLAAENQTIDR